MPCPVPAHRNVRPERRSQPQVRQCIFRGKIGCGQIKVAGSDFETGSRYVPGRMRIESPLLHENPAKTKEFGAFIRGLDGISDCQCYAPTGSAIIHFDEKKINCEQVIGILEEHDYFRLTEAETSDERIERAAEEVLGAAEKIVETAEGGTGEG